MLEDQLRQMFVAQADAAPAPDDPAGRAICRARVLRRRRTAGAGTAAVLVLVLALGGAASVRGQWQPDEGHGTAGRLVPPPEPSADAPEPVLSTLARGTGPSRSRQPDGLSLDLRVGHELWSATGARLALTGVGRVTRVYRVPLGWVYGGADAVRLLRPDGTSVALDGPGQHWVVSPDGRRLAFVRAGRLQVRPIGARGLLRGATAAVPREARPVAFAGERVIISLGEGGPFDAFDPGSPHPPAWSTAVVDVYGAAGGRLAGLVRGPGDGSVCLATLAAGRRGLEVRRTGGCGVDVPADAPAGAEATAADAAGGAEPAGGPDPAPGADAPAAGSAGVLAPGGRWLARRTGGAVVMVDLEAALEGRDQVVPCPLERPLGAVWVDDATLVVAGERGALRCGTDGAAQAVALPAGMIDDWALVPPLLAPAPTPSASPR